MSIVEEGGWFKIELASFFDRLIKHGIYMTLREKANNLNKADSMNLLIGIIERQRETISKILIQKKELEDKCKKQKN